MKRNEKFTCLVLANKELVYQNCEKEKRAAELIIANKELVFQNEEKEKRAQELTASNFELKKVQEFQIEYIIGLEKMMYMISHEVRKPIAELLGLSNLLKKTKTSKPLALILNYIRESIKALDNYTRDLTKYLGNMVYKSRQSK